MCVSAHATFRHVGGAGFIFLSGEAASLHFALAFAHRKQDVFRTDAQATMGAVELLQAIVDSPTRHGIIVTDVDGNIILWNRGAGRIFQYTNDEIVGSNVRMLFASDDLAPRHPRKGNGSGAPARLRR